MEVVRPSTDRLKAILTNKGIYFVKSGPPCPENIKLHVEYTRLLDSQYYFEGERCFHISLKIFILLALETKQASVRISNLRGRLYEMFWLC